MQASRVRSCAGVGSQVIGLNVGDHQDSRLFDGLVREIAAFLGPGQNVVTLEIQKWICL